MLRRPVLEIKKNLLNFTVTVRYGYSTIRLQYGTVRIRYGQNTVRSEYGTVTVRYGYKAYVFIVQLKSNHTENRSSDHVAPTVVIVADSTDARNVGCDERRHLEQRLQVPEHEQDQPGLQVDDEETHGVPGVARVSRGKAQARFFHFRCSACTKTTARVNRVVNASYRRDR